MSRLQNLESYIRKRITEDGITHSELSEELQHTYADERGLSTRSLERFCSTKGIRKTSRLPQESVERAVEEAILRVSARK